MATYMKIAVDHPTFMNNGDFFTMSGTSQAAAVVSGVAALVLSQNPGLTPDQVKCRIIASGKPAVTADGSLAYSVMQQGTGLVDAKTAVYGTANKLREPGPQPRRRSQRHAAFHGPRHTARRWHLQGDESERFPLGQRFPVGQRLPLGQRGSSGDAGFLWDAGYLREEGFLWSQAQNYSTDIKWVTGYPSLIGNSVGTASAMSVNSWVAPE